MDTVKEPNRSHSILATNRRLGESGGQGAVRGKERVWSLAARMPMPQGVGRLERSDSGQSVRGRRRAKSNNADKLHLRSVICGEVGIGGGCYKKLVQHAHSTVYACGFTNELAGKEVYWMQGGQYNSKQSTADGQGDSP